MEIPEGKPLFEQMEDERRAEFLARKQMGKDIRDYQREMKLRSHTKAANQGGGAKERARRLKRMGVKADLSGVPGPEDAGA